MAVLEADGCAYRFRIQCKSSGAAAQVSQAARRVAKRHGHVHDIPLVVVPYMGNVGRQLCEETGASWVDLSGNAHIVHPRPPVRIHIEGKPNRFKSAGRPPNPFAAKSSRIARCLLQDPSRALTQRELSVATDVSEGFVSHIVHRLEDLGLLVREESGALRVPDPELLLQAWTERYDFSKHQIVEAHVMTRSPELLLHELPPFFEAAGWEYAFTGLAGAWLCAPFASYGLTTVYVRDPKSSAPEPDALPTILEKLSFRIHPRAPNLWVVFPRDDGVFQFAGPQGKAGIRSAHPVQVYLDLSGHPERSDEAAAELKKQRMNWGTRG